MKQDEALYTLFGDVVTIVPGPRGRPPANGRLVEFANSERRWIDKDSLLTADEYQAYRNSIPEPPTPTTFSKNGETVIVNENDILDWFKR